jgi:hypothetical protein
VRGRATLQILPVHAHVAAQLTPLEWSESEGKRTQVGGSTAYGYDILSCCGASVDGSSTVHRA